MITAGVSHYRVERGTKQPPTVVTHHMVSKGTKQLATMTLNEPYLSVPISEPYLIGPQAVC